jgi:hypothetical protein
LLGKGSLCVPFPIATKQPVCFVVQDSQADCIFIEPHVLSARSFWKVEKDWCQNVGFVVVKPEKWV